MEFVALDLETTGLDPKRHEIVEIGLVRFSGGRPVDKFDSLLKPSALPQGGAIPVCGIGAEELAGAPPPDAVLPRVLAAIEGELVVAHNAPFDRAFLAEAARKAGLRLPPVRWVDTLALARALWPREGGYSLEALKGRLGLSLPGHRALPDAEAAGHIFIALLSELESLPDEARARLSPQIPDEVWGLLPHGGLEGAFLKLERIPGFVHRPAQRAYSREALAALRAGKIALLEAGPGTGKTFGYLVPLLLTLAEGGRAVIATRTRALQEQLWRHDLPTALAALGATVPVALLKGRENYLCLKRLEELRLRLVPGADPGPLFSWAESTRSGDLDELSELAATPEGRDLLREVRDDPLHCSGPACPLFHRCLSRRARDAARKARLVVVNHALLGADVAREGRILGPYEYLVVDEAHGLADAIRDALSLEFNPVMVPRVVAELAQFEEGGGKLRRLRDRLALLHRRFWEAAAPAFPDEPTAYSREGLSQLLVHAGPLRESLEELAELLGELAEGDDEERGERARGLAGEAVGIASTMKILLTQSLGDHVYWRHRGPAGPALRASPIEIGPHLAESLWPRLAGAVLTSATLAVGGKMDHLIRELGIPKSRTSFGRWRAPFDYQGVRAYVVTDIPQPDSPGYPGALAELIRAVLTEVPKRALVLFTSRRSLLSVRKGLVGVPVLAQGVDGEREGLLSRFRSHPPPVALLGLDSLWEGVDLPGEEMEILFIARLPFPVPTDPLAQAQAARLREEGWEPFAALFLPRAVLKLRQGVGRLVRTPQDRGAIVIADSRAAARAYGRAFLEELPVPAGFVNGAAELVAAVREALG